MFCDSTKKEVKPYRFVEQATTLPKCQFPVYLGSGECVISLDATGMQGINNLFQDAYGGTPHAGDMYVVGHGILAKGVNRFFDKRYWGEDINTLPYGWLDYALVVDGQIYEPEDIAQKGAVFMRDIDLKHAQVTTSYILDSKIKVEICAFVPYGTSAPVFAFRVKSHENARYIPKENHSVQVVARLHLTVRDGKPLFDTVEYAGDRLTVTKRGHEDYCLHYLLSNTQSVPVQSEALMASMQLNMYAEKEWSSWQSVMFSFNAKHSVNDLGVLRQQHIRHWHDFFESIASVETGDAEEEYLFNHSKYLFHMAYNMEYSIQLGHPFYFLGCWQACTFWDTVFAVDALCRLNDRESMDKLVGYYHRIMRKEGKPYVWMTIYDGHTFLDPKKDNAPLVISAVAMIAIRHYESFKDDAYLRDCLYPIIKSCATYAVENMFVQNEAGKWYVGMPVSNDVVDEEGEEVNQTFTTLWFATVLRKAYEYGVLLGTPEERFKEISDGIYVEQTETEYLHCKGTTAAEWHWASWIPFMLYPTEAMPFVDMDLCQKTLDRYTYTDLYMEKQNSWQPWTECIEAQSRNRAGRPDEAYRLIREAMGHTFGAGYFSEIGPHQQTVAYPPYVSAHGSFTAAFADQFASGSIWERAIKLFHMSGHYSGRRIELKNLRCVPNVLIKKAVYRPDGVTLALQGSLDGLSIELNLPDQVDINTVKLFVNGAEHSFKKVLRNHKIIFELDCCTDADIEVV
ncbi:MAG: hypothetical protein E7448_04755 [Ruminococcaceae bacterium]|nr:hypothetical protein [Oscillospiraceae bacterium]